MSAPETDCASQRTATAGLHWALNLMQQGSMPSVAEEEEGMTTAGHFEGCSTQSPSAVGSQ